MERLSTGRNTLATSNIERDSCNGIRVAITFTDVDQTSPVAIRVETKAEVEFLNTFKQQCFR